MCTKKDYGLLCHLIGTHSIHKHSTLRLLQRAAAEKRVLAEQQAREADEAKRLARAAWKAGTSAPAPAAPAPAPPAPQETSRFSKIFAATEQRRQLAFCGGYSPR